MNVSSCAILNAGEGSRDAVSARESTGDSWIMEDGGTLRMRPTPSPLITVDVHPVVHLSLSCRFHLGRGCDGGGVTIHLHKSTCASQDSLLAAVLKELYFSGLRSYCTVYGRISYHTVSAMSVYSYILLDITHSQSAFGQTKPLNMRPFSQVYVHGGIT